LTLSGVWFDLQSSLGRSARHGSWDWPVHVPLLQQTLSVTVSPMMLVTSIFAQGAQALEASP
jgi:hypothetical protein